MLDTLIDEIQKSLIPKIDYVDEIQLDEQYFYNFIENARECLDVINSSLEKDEIKNILRTTEHVECENFLINVLLICGEHSSCYLWSTENTKNLSAEIIEKICCLLQCNIKLLFVRVNFSKTNDAEKSVAMLLLKVLRPKLLKDEWKKYPAAVATYKWIITNITMPHMYNYMYAVFPTSLNILDDYQTSNKRLGLECLTCILRSLTSEQVKHYCTVELFYDTVKSLLYWREDEIIVPLIECILEISEKQNTNYLKQSISLKWCKYLDETLNVLLPIIEFEQSINLQIKYMEALYIIMKCPGVKLSIGRWSDRLISIFDSYSSFRHTSQITMQVMNLYFMKCFPLIRKYAKKLILVCARTVSLSEDEITFNRSCRCYSILYEHLSNELTMPTLDYLTNLRKASNGQQNRFSSTE